MSRVPTTQGTANKALQVTPVRRAKCCLLGVALSHRMSHLVGSGGAPELDR
jgi:hypothetical protein